MTSSFIFYERVVACLPYAVFILLWLGAIFVTELFLTNGVSVNLFGV